MSEDNQKIFNRVLLFFITIFLWSALIFINLSDGVSFITGMGAIGTLGVLCIQMSLD